MAKASAFNVPVEATSPHALSYIGYSTCICAFPPRVRLTTCETTDILQIYRHSFLVLLSVQV